MAVAEKTSIFGRAWDTLKGGAGKIQRAGAGVINQIKPFGQGAKPKIGPQGGGGYQPRGAFGGGGSQVGKWEAGRQSGTRRAQQIWANKYNQQWAERSRRIADQVRQAEIDRALRPGISWQPWKDPKRPLSGRLPPSPTLTPIQGANQAAKEGAKQVGRKTAQAAGTKLLGKGIALVPIIGQAIVIGQTAFDIGKSVAEAINETERKIWEEMGLIPELGENGTVPGGGAGTDPDPPPEIPDPPPDLGGDPEPPPGEFDDQEIVVGTLGPGWHKLHVKMSSTRDYSVYQKNFALGTYSLLDSDRLTYEGEGWAWVLGPGQKFLEIQRLFQDTRNYFGTWSVRIYHFFAARGWVPATSNLNESPPYPPSSFEDEPVKLSAYPIAGFSTIAEKSWGYAPSSIRWIKDDSYPVVSIKWYTSEGEPEDDIPDAPAPVPKRRRRKEEDDVADCPNIKPLLIQQNQIINQRLAEQTAQVNEAIAGMQLEINAGNQNIINAVNQADAAIAADFTEVKNRLGPQIPDGISTKVSNHYDEFRNFLGEAWDTTKGTFDDLMTKFNEYLETFKKFLKWMHIDRVLNILTFIATVHNAYMLSANLGQTLISALNTILTVAGNALGLRDVEDAPIEVGEAIGDTFENIAKSILGAENLEGMRAEWKKYSRIYQAASHVLWAIQSINQSIIGALEIVGSNVAKIGNAIKKWGEVAENAYAWMNPTPYFQNKFFTTLESLEDAGGTVEIVALETLSAQEEISQFQQVKEEFDKAMAQTSGGVQGAGSPEAQQVKATEEAAKGGSGSQV